jgi:hypothetical protein
MFSCKRCCQKGEGLIMAHLARVAAVNRIAPGLHLFFTQTRVKVMFRCKRCCQGSHNGTSRKSRSCEQNCARSSSATYTDTGKGYVDRKSVV